MFGELAQLAIGNLGRARARLFMTAGGVLVGTTAVILLIALTFGLQRSAEASIGSDASLTEIQVYPAWDRQLSEDVPQLTIDAVRAFWRIPGVEAVIPVAPLQTGAELVAGDYRGWGEVMGIDPSLLPYLGAEIHQGVMSLQPGEVIVGAQVSQNFYDPEAEEWQPITVDVMSTPMQLTVYQYTETTSSQRDFDLKIVGQLAPGGFYDYAILMPIQEVLKMNEWATGQETDPDTFTFNQIVVRAESREVTSDVTKAIRDLGYGAGGIGDYIDQLNNFFVTMRLILGFVGGVALLVAAFGVANTMMMAILERTKEIGLMKAIGATDRDVLTVFLIEAGLVGLSGGLAGIGLSLFLQNVINKAVSTAPDPASGGFTAFLPFDTSQLGGNLIVIPGELLALAVILATLVGLGAGLFPAVRAAKMQPVDALKQE
jgi:putative ABC transport system permease protein